MPTVGDRVAQTVVARVLEEKVEPIFHPDSYGYRPGRSALDAVGGLPGAVLEVRLGDRSRHPEVLRHRAVGPDASRRSRRYTDLPWVVLYVKRWLAAPLQLPDGTLQQRDRGTPQGSAVSPVLANLFLHYAFDTWMAREFPGCPFERYADDAVMHCGSLARRERCWRRCGSGWREVGLRTAPGQDADRVLQGREPAGSYEHTAFTFLGFTFRGREARAGPGNGSPGSSRRSARRLEEGSGSAVLAAAPAYGDLRADLADWINPMVRGWMQYYGAFNRSALYPLLNASTPT